MQENPSEEESIEARCIAIIAKSKLISPDAITRQTTFDELQIDSLDKINISFEIEDASTSRSPTTPSPASKPSATSSTA